MLLCAALLYIKLTLASCQLKLNALLYLKIRRFNKLQKGCRKKKKKTLVITLERPTELVLLIFLKGKISCLVLDISKTCLLNLRSVAQLF